MEAAPEEVLALMDSCMARFVQPYSEEAAPYLLERAQMRLNAGQGRGAMLDYDEYYKAVRGNVNDCSIIIANRRPFRQSSFSVRWMIWQKLLNLIRKS